MIPLVDLGAQLATIRPEIDAAIGKVLDQTAFVLGPHVESFERAFAEFVGAKHALCVHSGTAALHLAFLAAGIGPGDDVITAPSSFFATAEAIALTGARPVFADVDPGTLNLDPERVRSAITAKTKAIVPVHLFGQTADMDPLRAIAKEKNLLVIEDAAQAHGATYKNERAGSMALAACFSFYPGKNLGALGEGGAITTNDDAIAARVRLLRDHGSPKKYEHTIVGYNYRLDGIQGAILSVKLTHLPAWTEARRSLAGRYTEKLQGLKGLTLPTDAGHGKHAWHLYAVRSEHRERVFRVFADAKIAQAIHYPIPIHRQEAFRDLNLPEGSFPIAEEAARTLFSLPLYPELGHEKQDHVIEAVKKALG